MKACYVHVPFCKSICAYCDFTRCGYQKQLADKWLVRMCEEINSSLKGDLATLYIGGGTPTALSDEQLEILLKQLHPYVQKIQEYTIEANPDSLTPAKMELFQKYGINRISLGIQTFQPQLQSIIKRIHTLSYIEDLLRELQFHEIDNVSIDLMYGLPQQTMDMWKQDLKIAVQLPIKHISLYALTIEEHSQFGRDHILAMDDQLEADMYEYAIEYLEKHAFHQYEISNFSKAGYTSQHNTAYWKYEDFKGIGCGASGKEHHRRYDNTSNLHTYITKGPCPEITNLTRNDEMFETLMMSLRMHEGLNLNQFRNTFHMDVSDAYSTALKKNVDAGNLEVSDHHVKTTYRGRLLLNTVLLDFLS